MQAVLDRYKSPLNAEEYIKACSPYPVEMCKIFIGVMTHESRLCTKFYKPEVEKGYYNCSGWKSKRILETKRADENGSWLRKFTSYENFYDIVLESFHRLYWQQGLMTPEAIVRKYVGKYSQNWVDTVNSIVNKL